MGKSMTLFSLPNIGFKVLADNMVTARRIRGNIIDSKKKQLANICYYMSGYLIQWI